MLNVILLALVMLLPTVLSAVALAKVEALAQVGSEFIFDRAPFPSSHASTIVETREGLVAAWFGGTRERDPDVGIWVSRRDGSGWTPPVEVANGVQADGTRHPSWNPVLFQPSSGPLVLFYKVGPSPSQWWGMARTSPDGGRTWSAAIKLPPGILGPIRAKPIEISRGVMLAGSSTEHDGWVAHMERFVGPWDAQGLASAAAWQKSGPLNAKDEFGAIQPAILAHSATELQILLRSRQRVIAEAWSKDGGISWGRMTATSLPNPSAGIDALRLADGRFLLVYNPSATSRAKLALAVSRDGKSWRQVTMLEDESEGEFSYPAMIQSRDGQVHITYTWRRQKIKHVAIDPATIGTSGLADAQPIDPITGILEMFKNHDVVALSEGNHGNEQGHAFRLALIRDPRFPAAVNDIVVEFGNAHYQAVIDRFVQGEQVAYEELRKVWQDTTQRGTVWDRPIYEEFYRAVRDVNAALPVERRLRVLLGDIPMDWYAAQRSSPPRTDDFPASVVQREVLAKKRRALVIYGGLHLIRKHTPFLPAKDPALAPIVAVFTSQMQNGSIVAQLDRLGARVFVVATSTDFDISTIQANVVEWRRPALALIRGTPLGLASSLTYFPRSLPVLRGRGGIQETLQPDPAAVPPMQEVVDAILYLGPPSAITQSRLSRELCADPAYVKMRIERLTEFTSSGAAAFTAECAAVLQR